MDYIIIVLWWSSADMSNQSAQKSVNSVTDFWPIGAVEQAKHNTIYILSQYIILISY